MKIDENVLELGLNREKYRVSLRRVGSEQIFSEVRRSTAPALVS